MKTVDNVYTTYLISPWTKRLLPYLSGRVTPNGLTAASIVLAVTAAGLFALGSFAATVAGAVVYQLSFAADCLDGQLARYDAAATRFGALLDWQFDRVKETAVIAGLAAGAGGEWLYAAALLAALGARSAITVSFTTMRMTEGTAPGRQGPGRMWQLRSAILLPYGDRHLVLGGLAVAAGAGPTLIVLLFWSLYAAVLQATGRLARFAAHHYHTTRSDLFGDGYLADRISHLLGIRLWVFVAVLVAFLPAAMPPGDSWGLAHLVLLVGLLLTARTTPPWMGPLTTYGFELGTVLVMARAGVDPALVFAATAAMVLLRHFVNSDALTGGPERSRNREPLGWELRSVGWLATGFTAPAIGVALAAYVGLAALVRMSRDLATRRREDRKAAPDRRR